MEDNFVMEEGREFEEAIFRIGCRKYGLDPHPGFKLGTEWVDGVLSGHPDRLVSCRTTGLFHVAEIKHTLFGRAGTEKWGEPFTDQVPPHYRLQAMVYQWMLRGQMAGQASGHAKLLARLDDGVACYEIPVVEVEIMAIQEAAREMLDRVARNDPPPPLEGNEADQRMRWLARPGKRHEASTELRDKLAALAATSKGRKELEERESQLKAEILAEIEDAEEVVVVGDDLVPRVIATAKANSRFDAKAFASDHPDIISRFQVQEIDWAALKKENRGLAERYMRAPLSALEQTRVLRIK